ncbi:MAG: tRNA preQ1(34) S-adenosylmethionine ribosyltransferase-isomerase QueA [Gammaproteobacteria bacterium]|nr:tRNA preQ1(34) S-adenosylmethionine ribosyltransferase-isomerase QueA [Gammaproteobacteria bacterium]
MNTLISSYDYNLPENLIAKSPLEQRSDSKLLHYNLNKSYYSNQRFSNLLDILNEGDLLIMNNTKVIPARINLHKESGGKIEILFNRKINKDSVEVIFSSSRKPLVNSYLIINNKRLFKVLNINKNYLTLLKIIEDDIFLIFKEHGEIPLPKYIKRPLLDSDKEKYQTVYAESNGSVAAPTAGLHFTQEMINKILELGVTIRYLTLHISYNTFKPIIVEDFLQHDIGEEYIKIDQQVFSAIETAKTNGSRVISVGTTVARSLEYCYTHKIKNSYEGPVDIFIYPDYKFKAINCLITNFHLPKSSLLLLVCAFAGKENIIDSYNYAIENNYRFYSYGDSMLLENI